MTTEFKVLDHVGGDTVRMPRIGDTVLFTDWDYVPLEHVRLAIVLEVRFDGTLLLRVLRPDLMDVERVASFSETPRRHFWHHREEA